MRGGGGGRGGHLDPEIRRGPGLKTKFFRPFGPHFGPQIRGVTEPLDPPLGSLSKDVFERRTLAGSETFSFFIRLDANKFVLLSSFSLIKAICPRVWTKPLPNNPNSPLPVVVRRPKTLLFKLSSGSFCVGDVPETTATSFPGNKIDANGLQNSLESRDVMRPSDWASGLSQIQFYIWGYYTSLMQAAPQAKGYLQFTGFAHTLKILKNPLILK